MTVYGYLRVSTEEQANSGLGLDAQRAAIQGEAKRRGWQVEWTEDAGVSGRTINRPGMASILGSISAGDALVVAKLDRLSRSLLDFAGLMQKARAEGWAVVALDLGVDTTTPSGQLMAHVMASFAEYERAVISQRTRDALAAKRAQGHTLGRPPRELPAALVGRVLVARAAGRTLQAIADDLNAEGVPTPAGGRAWTNTTVRRVVLRHEQKVK